MNKTHLMKHSSIRPIGDHILIQHRKETEKVEGGIFLPDSAREKPQEAKVIALGSGRKGKDGVVMPFQVRVGDDVLVARFVGSEVKLAGETYTILGEDDILGVLASQS